MEKIIYNPHVAPKISTGIDLFPQGFSKAELREAYYELSEDGLIFEAASFREIDEYYNPGAFMESSDMILEALTMPYGTMHKRMALLGKIFNRYFKKEGDIYVTGEPIEGKVKKIAGFATVTGTLNLSDEQSIHVIFHAPEGDRRKIAHDDTLIAFRWLLNKKDITHFVSPENGKDISIQTICKRIAQFAVKNSEKFQEQQAKSKAKKEKVTAAQAKIDAAQAKKAELENTSAEIQNETDTMDEKVINLKKRIEKQREYNDELRGKIDNWKSKQTANEGKAEKGGDTPATEAEIKEEEKKSLADQLLESFRADLAGLGFTGFDLSGASEPRATTPMFYNAKSKNGDPRSLLVDMDGVGGDSHAVKVYFQEGEFLTFGYEPNDVILDQKTFTAKTEKGLKGMFTKAFKWVSAYKKVLKDAADKREGGAEESGLDNALSEKIAAINQKKGSYSKSSLLYTLDDLDIFTDQEIKELKDSGLISDEDAARVRMKREAEKYENDRAAHNAAVDETRRLVDIGQSAVPGVRAQDAEKAGKMSEMLSRGEITQDEWDAYVKELEEEGKIRKTEPPTPADAEGDAGADEEPSDAVFNGLEELFKKAPPYVSKGTNKLSDVKRVFKGIHNKIKDMPADEYDEKIYDDLENENFNTENLVLLAMRYGKHVDEALEMALDQFNSGGLTTKAGNIQSKISPELHKMLRDEIDAMKSEPEATPPDAEPEPTPEGGGEAIEPGTVEIGDYLVWKDGEPDAGQVEKVAIVPRDDAVKLESARNLSMNLTNFRRATPEEIAAYNGEPATEPEPTEPATEPEPAENERETQLVDMANAILNGDYDELSGNELADMMDEILELEDMGDYDDLLDEVDAYVTELTKKAAMAA